MNFDAGSIVSRLTLDSAEFSKSIGQAVKTAEQSLGKKLSASLGSLGKKFSIAGGLGTAALGAITASALETQEKVANLATLGVDDLASLRRGAYDLAKTIGGDVNENMDQLYQIISAGMPEGSALMVLESATKGARAGVGELSDAVDLGTSLINAYGLEVSDFDRIMGLAATTVKNGKTTLGEMGSAIGRLAPLAANAGVGVEEMMAAIAALTKTGSPATEQIAALKQVIASIVTPSEKAVAVAKDLELSFNAAALESQGLAGMMDAIKMATGGNVEKMGQLFGSVEALNAVLSLTGTQAGTFSDTLTDMSENAITNLEEMNAAYAKNNQMVIEMEKMKAATKDLKDEIADGLMPVQLAMLTRIRPLTDALGKFARAHPEAVAAVGGLTVVTLAAIVPLGAFLLVMGKIVAHFELLKIAILGITMGGALAGLSLAIAAFVQMYYTKDWTKNFITDLVDSIPILKDAIDLMFDDILASWDRFVKHITTGMSGIPWLENVIKFWGNLAGEEWARAQSTTSRLMGGYSTAISGARADGGPVSRAGSYLVGERGPEIVTLPGGSYVTPNHEITNAPISITVNVSGGNADNVVSAIKRAVRLGQIRLEGAKA